MKCQLCEKPATFHITELTGPTPVEHHLCEICAKSYLADNDPSTPPAPTLAGVLAKQLKIGQAAEELARLDQRACPVCGISATDFPLADFQDSIDDQRVLLYCQACDDHFLPDWYRLCPRCGYDYGDGLAVEGTIEPLGFNWRSWLVLAILVAGAASMLGYVLWLFGWPQL